MSLYDLMTAAARSVADGADEQICALTAERDAATAAASAAEAEGEHLRVLLDAAHVDAADLRTALAASVDVRAVLEQTVTDLRATVEECASTHWARDAFILGYTVPTQDSTGCRIPYDDLVHCPGIVTSTHPLTGAPLQRGDVITGVRVSQMAVTVPGVRVWDVWVDGVGLDYDSPTSDYYRLVDARRSSGGATDADLVYYAHVTVEPQTRSYLNVAFQGSNFVAYRCRVRGVTDAFSPHSTGGQVPRAVDILGCFVDGFHVDTDPNQADRITHNDFVQAAGGLRRLTVHGNAVGEDSPPRTANILLQTNAGAYGGEGVRITRNWLRGHPDSGSTINAPVALGCPLVVADNEVHSGGKSPRLLINSTMRTASTTTISRNALDTGAAATINNA